MAESSTVYNPHRTEVLGIINNSLYNQAKDYIPNFLKPNALFVIGDLDRLIYILTILSENQGDQIMESAGELIANMQITVLRLLEYAVSLKRLFKETIIKIGMIIEDATKEKNINKLGIAIAAQNSIESEMEFIRKIEDNLEQLVFYGREIGDTNPNYKNNLQDKIKVNRIIGQLRRIMKEIAIFLIDEKSEFHLLSQLNETRRKISFFRDITDLP